MYIGDYEEPDVEKIAAKAIHHLVKDGDTQIGSRLVDANDEFMRDFVESQGRAADEADLDYVMLRRRAGYIDNDSFTDYSGLDVTVFTKNRSRGQKLMSEVTKALLRAEDTEILGFEIDFVAVLNGPTADEAYIMDDHIIEKSFEFQIRVKWL